jgi:hypothetical protein
LPLGRQRRRRTARHRAEAQRLGNGIARQAVRAIGAAHGFARGKQTGHVGRHVDIDPYAPHVIVGGRGDLDHGLCQVDAIGSQAVDDRPEGRAQLGFGYMTEAQEGTSRWRAAAGFDFFQNGVGRGIARDRIAPRFGLVTIGFNELFAQAATSLVMA